MKTKLITLRNDFHNTEVRVRVKGESPWKLSIGQTRRIDQELCGMTECQCGGIRGPQTVETDGDDVRLYVTYDEERVYSKNSYDYREELVTVLFTEGRE